MTRLAILALLIYSPPGLIFLKKSSALWRATKFPVNAPRCSVTSLQRPPARHSEQNTISPLPDQARERGGHRN
jgi:hypothetical protein